MALTLASLHSVERFQCVNNNNGGSNIRRRDRGSWSGWMARHTTLATLYRQKGEILDATLTRDYGEVCRGLRSLYDSAVRGGSESRRVVISHELWADRFRCRNCRETLVWCNNASHGHAFCYDCAVTLTEGTTGATVVCDHCQDRLGVIGQSSDGFRVLDTTDYRLMKSAVLECIYCDALKPACDTMATCAALHSYPCCPTERPVLAV